MTLIGLWWATKFDLLGDLVVRVLLEALERQDGPVEHSQGTKSSKKESRENHLLRYMCCMNLCSMACIAHSLGTIKLYF